MIKLNFPEDLWLNYIWNCIPLIFRVTHLNFLKQLLEKNTPKIVHLRELLKCIYNKCVPITKIHVMKPLKPVKTIVTKC